MKTVSGLSCQRFPPAIAHAAWLCVRFDLGLRTAEEMLPERGVDISYETIRRWPAKFGPQIARNLGRRQCRPGDVWQLDDVAAKIAGRPVRLWHAVDQHGGVRDGGSKRDGTRRPRNGFWPRF
uniref:hypothetical protein n=1 Tax=Mangrovicoccus ximenensis TaxID=1911570 RepID=UPI001F218913|nr:hypothetical protein [Mangrovicoccus ximenensis]